MKKKIDFSSIPEADIIVNCVYQRFMKGLYTLLLITGLPGTGKSSCGLRLSELISLKLHGENLITENDVVDSFLQFLKVLKNVKGPGKIIPIEEVSVLFPSRRSMAIDNVNLGKVLDTCRKKQVIIIANAPIFKSVESHMRIMASVLIETLGINKKEQLVISKTWRLQTNPHSGKTYRHTFQRKGRDINKIFTQKPNSETWEGYEDKKDEFIGELYVDLEHTSQKKKDKRDRELGNKIELIKPRDLEIYRLKEYSGLSIKEIAERYPIGSSSVSKIHKKVSEKIKNSSNINEYEKMPKEIGEIGKINLQPNLSS